MDFSHYIQSLIIIARELGINASLNNLKHLFNQNTDKGKLITASADWLNLDIKKTNQKLSELPQNLLPVLVALKENHSAVIHRIENNRVLATFSQQPEIKKEISLKELEYLREGDMWLISPRTSSFSNGINEYFPPIKEKWLWQLIRQDLKFYIMIALGAFSGNILALAGSLFSMQVYDRVIPAQSYTTLWVLFMGVIIALGGDMLLRMARSKLADAIGKRADLFMSASFFTRALRIKNSARPQSTGAFIAQIREIEHIRELMTSTTVLAIVDLPFILLFIGVIASIGNWLALPVMLAIPAIVIPGLLAQWPLAKLSQKGIRESALRNAMLVETVEGIEDIKLTQSEQRFIRQWNLCNTSSAQISLEQRDWSCMLTNWCQFVQQTVYVCVIALGVYLVIDNSITTGTLIACSILSSRTVAPLGQLAGVLTRLQHAMVASQGLSEFIARPVESKGFVGSTHVEKITGNYQLENVRFRFSPDSKWAIDIEKLTIPAGSKVAVIGTIGAGKSTLLRALSGMADDLEGEIQLDELNLHNISVDELRQHLGYLQQDAHLFHGTVRDNILLGNIHAKSEEIAHCLKIAGAAGVIKNKHGLDLVLTEGGKGLSGGQKQSLLLARTLLRNTPILLLDEPTASMDETTEQFVVNELKAHCKDKTLIIVTHRQCPLQLVDRIIIMDQGQIVQHGPRDEILATLHSKKQGTRE